MINKSFCSAPWTSMFYNKNGARTCCTNSEFVPGSPTNFRNSQFLKDIKKEFLEGKRPESCNNCWELEDAGLESIRTTVYNSVTSVDTNNLTIDSPVDLQYLELRASNLCNFSCRMCGPIDSNQIAKEIVNDPRLKIWFQQNELQELSLDEITNDNFTEIKNHMHTVKWLIITGGEPMIIKHYYELLDYLIEQNLSQNITLQFHTNASVYNNIIVSKLEKFNKIHITLSLDAAGPVAEYQRYGTDWSVVEKNCLELVKLPNAALSVNSALSAYTILDIKRFAEFLLKLYNANNQTWFTIRPVQYPKSIRILSLNRELRDRAIEQINLAENLLKGIPNFKSFLDGFDVWRQELAEPENQIEYKYFAQFTRSFDQSRNESFESTFNYKLY
jgi:organic radical activating enzyme